MVNSLLMAKKAHTKYENISAIIKKNLCNSCGVCEAVCPTSCIKFTWVNGLKKPEINFDKCINCGRCYRVCPGKDIKSCIGGYERYLGKIDESFIIAGAEKYKNKYTASGGFITSFLAYLLDSKKINGVLAVSLEGNDFKNAKGTIIENSSNLRKTIGSLYFSVPLGTGLKEVFKMKGKFAVVGLPCQTRGINNLIGQSNKFKGKIFIKIGLFCGFMIGYNAVKYLLDSLNIPNKNDIKKITFRAKKDDKEGFLVETFDKDYFIPISIDGTVLNRSFSNKRCLMCNDMTNEYADISCGDTLKFELKKSLIISRNEKATKLIKLAEGLGYLKTIRKMKKKDIFISQEEILRYKKDTIDIRLKIMRLINGKIPKFEVNSLPKSNFHQKMGALLYILNCYLTKNKTTRRMFFLAPKSLIKRYNSFIGHLLWSS